MQIGVRIFWHVVVEDDVHSLDVHTSAKQVSGHQDPPLEVLELLIARQPGGVWTEAERRLGRQLLLINIQTPRRVREREEKRRCVCLSELHLSSWAIPRWMAIAGKFCSTSSWDRAMQRCTDLTKITTYRQDTGITPGTQKTNEH